MTTIKCVECETVFDASIFGSKYAADSCKCGNLQILIKEMHHARCKYLTTVRFKRSEPEIVEVLEEKKEEIKEEKTKKLGFS